MNYSESMRNVVYIWIGFNSKFISHIRSESDGVEVCDRILLDKFNRIFSSSLFLINYNTLSKSSFYNFVGDVSYQVRTMKFLIHIDNVVILYSFDRLDKKMDKSLFG